MATTSGKEWSAFQDSAFRIRLARTDGTGEHSLDTVSAGPEDNPDWSPDGKRLTFVGAGNDGNGGIGLWVIGVDGTGLTRVVDCSEPCQYLDDPAWSPDGSQIMYSRLEPDAKAGGRLETVNLDSGKVRTVLTAKPGDLYSGVRYAPDGDIDGGALHPDFTNDGTAVLFAGSAAGTTNFMLVDLKSGKPVPTLTAGPLTGHHPRTQPTP